MRIRDATRADVPAIVAMLADDALGRAREQATDPLPESYCRAWDGIARDPNNRLIVAERDGQVIGCLQLTFIPGLSHRGAERAQIESVRVSSAIRGGGIGRQLIEYAIAEARKHGSRMVQLIPGARGSDSWGIPKAGGA
ncbi:MAG: GNAT family N-acetyltransferase [Alphaproteobacteria bacterium]|nr:GNAT family N-acetyltransferase [Alphaproteobacteria bacterium]